MIQGSTDPGWLADYARGSLRGKREELELVLHGQVTEHHRYLLAELLGELEFLEDRLGRLDQQLTTCMQPYAAQVERLCGRTKKGNQLDTTRAVPVGRAVTRKRNCHLTALFYRMAVSCGMKKAIVAVEHQILVTV